MPNAPAPVTRRHRFARASMRMHGALLVISVLLLSVFGIAPPVLATGSAAPDGPQSFTFPFSETFTGSSASSGWVFGGTPTFACLTSQNANCGNDPLLNGNPNGWLRLTSTATYQAGYAYYNEAIPTGRGLVITFDYGAWGGTGADGTTFFLFDGDPLNPFRVGASGGSLGYAQKTGVRGLARATWGWGWMNSATTPTPTRAAYSGRARFQKPWPYAGRATASAPRTTVTWRAPRN